MPSTEFPTFTEKRDAWIIIRQKHIQSSSRIATKFLFDFQADHKIK